MNKKINEIQHDNPEVTTDLPNIETQELQNGASTSNGSSESAKQAKSEGEDKLKTWIVNKLNKSVSEENFIWTMVRLAIIGGGTAVLLPLLLACIGFTGGVDPTLRLHLLYVTGGIIALLGLVETHRKNTQERVRNEDEKNKNKRDHERQIYAERRSRYSEAVKQLADDKAPIRMGGVYTLVGLADEWLEDNSLNEAERHKEGQIVINNLCAYIRSPFDLAERTEELKYYSKNLKVDFNGDIEKFEADRQAFTQDQARLLEEQEVRQTILSEIRNRLNGGYTSDKEVIPGKWSKFQYNFSEAIFFYEVELSRTNFTGEFIKFNEATFNDRVSFTNSKLGNAYFIGVNFNKSNSALPFDDAIFNSANFSKSRFNTPMTFRGANIHYADFSDIKFNKYADFSYLKFTRKYYFYGSFFKSANFYETNFIKQKPEFIYNSFGAYKPTHFALYSDHVYNVSKMSSYSIDTEKYSNPDGTITIIPKGSIAFNPLLTKVSVSDADIKGISVKGVSANGIPQIKAKLEMSTWPRKNSQIQSLNP